jgi:hypothetical protein
MSRVVLIPPHLNNPARLIGEKIGVTKVSAGGFDGRQWQMGDWRRAGGEAR